MKTQILSHIELERIKNIVQVCDDATCSICVNECLMLREFTNSPKALFSEVLQKRSIDPIIPFSCTLCGYCEKVCPKDIKLNKVFKLMRENFQKHTKKKFILKGHKGIYLHQKLSQSKVFGGLKNGSYKIAFMPGCSLSAYDPLLVEKTYNYLKSIYPGIGSISSCCSKPLFDLGNIEDFNKNMSELNESIESKGIQEIIVGCQNCYDTISKSNHNVRVRTLWQIFEERGLPEISWNSKKSSDYTFSIHDPCSVMKSPEIRATVHGLIESLGINIDQSINEIKSKCCGMGGMAAVSHIDLGKRVMKERASEMKNEKIITYCAACTEALSKGNKDSYHILELIFEPEKVLSEYRNMTNQNTLMKWIHRYQTKYKIT